MGVGIDWFAVLLLLAAYAFSRVNSVKLSIRLGFFALAFFVIAGFRAFRGAAGVNLLFVAMAVFFGGRYLWDAIKAFRSGQ